MPANAEINGKVTKASTLEQYEDRQDRLHAGGAQMCSAVPRGMNVFPVSAANPCRCFFLLTICMQLSMWINGDWRVAESGCCGVINQHNECR